MSERHTTWAEYRDALLEMPDESIDEVIAALNEECAESE